MSSEHTAQVLDMGDQVAEVSAWIDRHNTAMTPTEHLWSRVGKIGEEAGEVVAAMLGMLGENPRKGVTHSRGDVEAELLDVACCALAAVEHLYGNDGSSVGRLANKIDAVHARMLAHQADRAVPA
jgi:hypothetical protein